MKKISKVIAAVLVIGGMVLLSRTSAAQAQETIDLRKLVVTDEEEQFYRTQSASIKKYNRMLEKLTANPGARGSLRRYEESYGGAYINENGELVVLLTENVDKNRRMIQEYTEDDSIITKTCFYSYNELMEVIDTLNGELRNLAEQGVLVDEMYDDVSLNRVIIRVRNLNDEKEQLVRDIIDSGCMVFRNSEQGAVLQEGLCGGLGIVSGDNGLPSTLGFCATRNGVEGYVTAGHSANRIGEEFTYNGEVIGEVTHTGWYHNTTADAGFIQAKKGGTLTNYIMGHRCIGATGYEYPSGPQISMYGQKSGLQRGTIESYHSSFNESLDFGEYTTIDHARATYKSQEGDSGAPIFLYEGSYDGESLCTLIGIHSSRNFEQKPHFAKYGNIVKVLGVTAVTE